MIYVYLAAAFKLWMLIDAMRRHLEYYWYFIIALIPLGDWAYFFVFKFPELKRKFVAVRLHRPNSLEALSYAAKTTPSAENRLRLAEGLYDSGLLAEAREQFEAVLKTHPNDARALYGVAMTLKANGELTAAVSWFEKLLECSPAHEDYVAVLELVDTHKQLQQPDEALALLEQLVRRSPRVKHHWALAEHLVDMGRNAEAKRGLDVALRDYEHSPDFVQRRERSFYRSAVALRKHLETI
jgi:hypothetical protein